VTLVFCNTVRGRSKRCIRFFGTSRPTWTGHRYGGPLSLVRAGRVSPHQTNSTFTLVNDMTILESVGCHFCPPGAYTVELQASIDKGFGICWA